VQHDFIRFGLLCQAATKHAAQTQSKGSITLAAMYRNKALEGLQRAVQVFDRESADAVLAGSIVMQYNSITGYVSQPS